MAKWKESEERTDNPIAEKPAVREVVGEGPQQQEMPAVPDGADEAAFTQGWRDGVTAQLHPLMPPPQNPFAEGTYQADNWSAGFAAVTPAPPPE